MVLGSRFDLDDCTLPDIEHAVMKGDFSSYFISHTVPYLHSVLRIARDKCHKICFPKKIRFSHPATA